MKKTVRITEEKLKKLIFEAIEKVLPTEFDGDEERYNQEEDFRNNYDFSNGDEEFDPTVEDPESYMMSKYYGGDDMDFSDGDLYGY